MDFMNRGSAQPQRTEQSAPVNVGVRRGKDGTRGMRVFSVALMFSVTVLLLALASSLFFGGKSSNSSTESKFVNKDQLQAVFLNGGQVYFGKIGSLNSQYVRLNDIYYLRVNQQVQPGQTQAQQDISLVKLGCELHGPTDEMLINREQVIFWENLKTDGQVAKAVEEYKKANPEGQKCATPSTSNTNSNTNQNQ